MVTVLKGPTGSTKTPKVEEVHISDDAGKSITVTPFRVGDYTSTYMEVMVDHIIDLDHILRSLNISKKPL